MTPREADIRIIELISSSPVSTQLGFWELKAKLWRAKKVSKAMERTILKWESIFKGLEKKKEWWNLKTDFITALHTKESSTIKGSMLIKEAMLEMVIAVALTEGILISAKYKPQ